MKREDEIQMELALPIFGGGRLLSVNGTRLACSTEKIHQLLVFPQAAVTRTGGGQNWNHVVNDVLQQLLQPNLINKIVARLVRGWLPLVVTTLINIESPALQYFTSLI